MNDEKKKLYSVSFGKLLIIFLIILVFAVYYLSSDTSIKLIQNNEKQIETFMASELDSIVTDTSDQYYVWRNFKEIIDTASKCGIESQQLSDIISESYSKYKISAKYFFYKNKKLIKGFNYTDKDLILFANILQHLNYEYLSPEYIESNRYDHNLLQEYFGPGNRLEIVKNNKGLLRTFTIKGGKQFYYWDNCSEEISIFFFTEEIPDFIERFNVVLAEKSNYNMGALDSNNKKIIPPQSFSTDQIHSAYMKSKKQNKSFIDSNNHYCFFQTLTNSDKVCYAIPINSNITNFFNWAEILEKISLLSLFILLTVFIISLFKQENNILIFLDNLSIKFRIIGILLISSVFPALMSLIFGFELLTDKSKVLEEAILSESLAGISKIEDQYKELQNKLSILSLELREAVKKEKCSLEMFKKHLDKYSIESNLAYLEVRDENINTIFSPHDRQTSGISDIMDLISRIVLKLHNPERLDSSKLNISPAELVAESVFSTDELGFSTLLRERGKQWTLKSSSHPTIWYWDVYPELATGPAFICFTSITSTSFRKAIEDYFENLQLASDSLQLYALICENEFSSLIKPNKQSSLPEKDLLNIAQTALKTNNVLFRTVNINNNSYWVTAKQEKQVESHVFMHLINKEERLKVLEPYKWQLIISGLFTLFISLLGAWLIINLVILPVGNLSKGIEAIRYRTKDFTIPVTRKDEFGKVALEFNKVIKEFDELDYGKVVQESLLPDSSPELEGYDIAYFNVAASDLAGDYHDHAFLEDGKLTILLGDVSGHGISASLAMAMAKATFDYAQSLKVKFPEDFMDMLNIMFNKELKPRNKLMTMISVVLNTKTGEVIFDNSGQAYPAYFTASKQTSEEIKMPSLPLGGMKKRKKKALIKNMEPGDAFIFYSDGIIEASSSRGEMFGYDRFFAKFTEEMKKRIPVKEAINNIYQAVESFREPGHHSDDITLIIVKRKYN